VRYWSCRCPRPCGWCIGFPDLSFPSRPQHSNRLARSKSIVFFSLERARSCLDWPVLLARTRSFGAVRPERERKLQLVKMILTRSPHWWLLATTCYQGGPLLHLEICKRKKLRGCCSHKHVGVTSPSTYKVCLASTPLNFNSTQYCNYHTNHGHDTPFI